MRLKLLLALECQVTWLGGGSLARGGSNVSSYFIRIFRKEVRERSSSVVYVRRTRNLIIDLAERGKPAWLRYG